MADQPRQAAEYALGYSEREKQRLVIQSRFYADLTERLFRSAGLGPGMSVLDVGCGVGDVSLLAASIVGPSGSVLGIDRAPARSRRHGACPCGGAENVAFEVADIPGLDPGRTFDALIGRLVLMYLPDPAATLAHLLGSSVPGESSSSRRWR